MELFSIRIQRTFQLVSTDQGRYRQSAGKKLHAGQVHGNPVCIEKRTAGVPQESE